MNQALARRRSGFQSDTTDALPARCWSKERRDQQPGRLLATTGKMPILLFFALLTVSGARVVAQEQPDAESYRKDGLTHEGDVSRGMKLFNEERRLGCARCHSVDRGASKAGPDLFAAGDAFGRRDLVEAILNPSATIAPGYGTVTVETKSGAVVMGTLQQKTDAVIQLMAQTEDSYRLGARTSKSNQEIRYHSCQQGFMSCSPARSYRIDFLPTRASSSVMPKVPKRNPRNQ